MMHVSRQPMADCTLYNHEPVRCQKGGIRHLYGFQPKLLSLVMLARKRPLLPHMPETRRNLKLGEALGLARTF